MSSLTLIDVRDWHRKCATICRRTNWPALANMYDDMADVIDAQIAGQGEPVAESCADHVKGETGYCTLIKGVA